LLIVFVISANIQTFAQIANFFLHFEAYFYFNVSEGNMICHLMGQPQQERVIWLANE